MTRSMCRAMSRSTLPTAKIMTSVMTTHLNPLVTETRLKIVHEDERSKSAEGRTSMSLGVGAHAKRTYQGRAIKESVN